MMRRRGLLLGVGAVCLALAAYALRAPAPELPPELPSDAPELTEGLPLECTSCDARQAGKKRLANKRREQAE
jgi:hypothetical protein